MTFTDGANYFSDCAIFFTDGANYLTDGENYFTDGANHFTDGAKQQEGPFWTFWTTHKVSRLLTCVCLSTQIQIVKAFLRIVFCITAFYPFPFFCLSGPIVINFAALCNPIHQSPCHPPVHYTAIATPPFLFLLFLLFIFSFSFTFLFLSCFLFLLLHVCHHAYLSFSASLV